MSWTAVVLGGSRPGRDAFAEQFGTDLKALIPSAASRWCGVRCARSSRAQDRQDHRAEQEPGRIAAVLPDDTRISVRRSQGTIAETILDLIDDATVRMAASRHHRGPCAARRRDRRRILQRRERRRHRDRRRRAREPDAPASEDEAHLAATFAAAPIPGKPVRLRSPEGGAGGRTVALGRAGPQEGMAHNVDPRPGAACEHCAAAGQPRRSAGQLGGKLGLSIKAVRLTNPLAGVDVDKAEDHALVEAILAGRA